MKNCLKDPESLATAPVVAAGLIGGWQVARATTAGLSAAYLGAFGLSHPLAKKIGAWPSVLTVAAVAAGLSYWFGDRD